MKKNGKPSKAEPHREVETQLNKRKQAAKPVEEIDIKSLIHTLEVRQIELEAQNEELIQARAEAEQAYRQYTDLYDFAPVGYFTLGRNGTILEANLAGANLLGINHKELGRRRFGAFVSSESLSIFNGFFENLLLCDGKRNCELAFEKKGNELLWARLEATCFEGGEVCRVMLTDITERKRMEQALQESEKRFRMLLQGVPTVAVQGYAMDGTTQYWNSASERLYGYSAQEAIGQNLLDLIIPPEMRNEVWQAIQQMAETGQPIPSAELVLMGKGGSRVNVYSSHAVVSVPGREPELFCLDIDLSENKRMASLLQARIQISEFAESHTLDELLQKTLDEAEALTGSQIGFAHFLDADQKTLHLQMWSTNTLKSKCSAEGKGSHYPVDQAGVWADCVATRAPLIHNDYSSLPNRKGLPQGHAPIMRELVVPVLRNDLIVMLMGVGNKLTNYNDNDVETLSQLANSTWDIIQRKQAEELLKESEWRNRVVSELTTDYIFVVDIDRNGVLKLRWASDNLFRITGRTIKDVETSELWGSIIHPDDRSRFFDFVNRVQATAESAELECMTLNKRSGERWVRIFARPQTGADNKVTIIVDAIQDVTERKQAEQALEAANRELQTALIREQELAHTDALTGINNRRYLYELAEHEFEIAARYQQPLSVIMFDLDHFKDVNDTFGHAAGDQILQSVTEVACAELRSADVIGRYGGEEFVIILPMTNAQQAHPLAERIRQGVSAIRVLTEKGDATVTLSIGIVEMLHGLQSGSSVEELIRRADEVMYAAKQAGRNRTKIGE